MTKHMGSWIPHVFLMPLWTVVVLVAHVRYSLASVPLIGPLIKRLYRPAVHPDEKANPAAYRAAMLDVERGTHPDMEHFYVQVAPEVYLHAAAVGDESKPLMLFLHGFPEFYHSWRDVMGAFADTHRCVAVDQRGYNISSKPADFTEYAIKHLVADVEMLIKKLGNGKRVVLVAHDWGGNVAWHVAHSTDLVEKLVMCNMPHPSIFQKVFRTFGEQASRSLYIAMFQVPLLPEMMLGQDNGNTVAKIIGTQIENPEQRAEFKAKHAQLFARAAVQPGALTGALNWYRNIFGGLQPKWQRKELDIPVLLLYGENDVAFDADEVLTGTEKYAPDLKIVRLPGTSHWTANDNPKAVVSEMQAFL